MAQEHGAVGTGAVGAQGFCNDREERWDKSHTTHLAPHGRDMGDAERWRSLAGLGLSGHDRRDVDQGLWDFQQRAGAAITASPGRQSRGPERQADIAPLWHRKPVNKARQRPLNRVEKC